MRLQRAVLDLDRLRNRQRVCIVALPRAKVEPADVQPPEHTAALDWLAAVTT